jgi:cell division protease FtsH
MDRPSKLMRSITLERVSYGIALKKAARLGGAFQKHNGRQLVIVAHLPVGANVGEYEAAADILAKNLAAPQAFQTAAPKVSRKGELDLNFILAEIRRETSLLIVWPPDHEIPRNVALATDRVVAVDPLRPFHLVAAAKVLYGQSISLADAGKILEHPSSAAFAAFRPGRPAEAVLRRLNDISPAPEASRDGVGLEDLVGYGEAKTWGLSLAEDIRAWKAGLLKWTDVDRGMLLSGPPGTGKTMFAKALALSCDVNVVATSAARWQSAGYLGDSLRAMRESFQTAIAQKPSVLFIDELDAIGDRATLVGSEHQIYWTQVVNLLLELIDGHDKLDGVVVIGATNHPDVIDPALLRPGRLDRHVRITFPDSSERKHLARTYFGTALSENDVERIALATSGFSGAAFEQAGRQVRREARRAQTDINIEIVMRNLPAAIPITGPQRATIAIHEAPMRWSGFILELERWKQLSWLGKPETLSH